MKNGVLQAGDKVSLTLVWSDAVSFLDDFLAVRACEDNMTVLVNKADSGPFSCMLFAG